MFICLPSLVDYEQPKIGYLTDKTLKSQQKNPLYKDALLYKIFYQNPNAHKKIWFWKLHSGKDFKNTSTITVLLTGILHDLTRKATTYGTWYVSEVNPQGSEDGVENENFTLPGLEKSID